jgi:hypothetical protein
VIARLNVDLETFKCALVSPVNKVVVLAKEGSSFQITRSKACVSWPSCNLLAEYLKSAKGLAGQDAAMTCSTPHVSTVGAD